MAIWGIGSYYKGDSKEDERYNVYNNTLYEEFNPKIIEEIIKRI